MKKELKTENTSNKRYRVESGLDSVSDSPVSKRVNTDIETGPTSSELSRVDSQSGVSPNRSNLPVSNYVQTDGYLNSPEDKQIREDILDILDEPDAMTECPPEIQDLDSVMKSFEEEILHPSHLHHPQTVLHLTSSESGDSQPDLGYLLEASDDELGLPPTLSSPDKQYDAQSTVMPEAADFVNMVGFEEEMPNYDTFDFGMDANAREGDNNSGNSNDVFVTVGGLFDYPEPANFSDFSWRQESLSAL